MFLLGFLKCTRNTIRSFHWKHSSLNIKGASAETVGGWAQGSSKVWVRKCAIHHAGLILLGTFPLHQLGHRFLPCARTTTTLSTPSTSTLNRTEIKHHLLNMYPTSSLGKPSGKLFFNASLLNLPPKHTTRTLAGSAKKWHIARASVVCKKRSDPLLALQPKLRQHWTSGTACPLLVSLSSMEGQGLGGHSQRTEPCSTWHICTMISGSSRAQGRCAGGKREETESR